MVVGYEHATQLLGFSYSFVWTLPALTVMPLVSAVNPFDLDYTWTFVAFGASSLFAAFSTAVSWYYSNKRGSQIHPQVAADAWVLVPVPVVDVEEIRRFSYDADEETEANPRFSYDAPDADSNIARADTTPLYFVPTQCHDAPLQLALPAIVSDLE